MAIVEPQSNMELANSLVPDMSLLDQNLSSLQRLQREVILHRTLINMVSISYKVKY